LGFCSFRTLASQTYIGPVYVWLVPLRVGADSSRTIRCSLDQERIPSANIIEVVAVEEYPTAAQAFPAQETLTRLLLAAVRGLGVGCALQADPSQVSARVICLLALTA
jgi:hypothetical protein